MCYFVPVDFVRASLPVVAQDTQDEAGSGFWRVRVGCRVLQSKCEDDLVICLLQIDSARLLRSLILDKGIGVYNQGKCTCRPKNIQVIRHGDALLYHILKLSYVI